MGAELSCRAKTPGGGDMTLVDTSGQGGSCVAAPPRPCPRAGRPGRGRRAHPRPERDCAAQELSCGDGRGVTAPGTESPPAARDGPASPARAAPAAARGAGGPRGAGRGRAGPSAATLAALPADGRHGAGPGAARVPGRGLRGRAAVRVLRSREPPRGAPRPVGQGGRPAVAAAEPEPQRLGPHVHAGLLDHHGQPQPQLRAPHPAGGPGLRGGGRQQHQGLLDVRLRRRGPPRVPPRDAELEGGGARGLGHQDGVGSERRPGPAEPGLPGAALPRAAGAAAGAGGRRPGPASAPLGAGDAPADHSVVSGPELLPPQHHREVAAGPAAPGRPARGARGPAAQRGRDLPGVGGPGRAPRGGAGICLPGAAPRPGAAPHCHLGALCVGRPGLWHHQRDPHVCRPHLPRWGFVQIPTEEAGFPRHPGELCPRRP